MEKWEMRKKQILSPLGAAAEDRDSQRPKPRPETAQTRFAPGLLFRGATIFAAEAALVSGATFVPKFH